MDTAELPPKPDPATGRPRPPRPPGTADDREPPRRSGGHRRPPAGQGPVLEWYRPGVRGSALGGGVAAGGLVAAAGLAPWTVPGVGGWLALLVALGVAALLSWNAWGTYLAAGADWLQSRGSWVRTYELTTVKFLPKSGGFLVLLEDSAGQSTACDLGELQENPELWSLVHNGILHSVAGHGAWLNLVARERLPLPEGVARG